MNGLVTVPNCGSIYASKKANDGGPGSGPKKGSSEKPAKGKTGEKVEFKPVINSSTTPGGPRVERVVRNLVKNHVPGGDTLPAFAGRDLDAPGPSAPAGMSSPASGDAGWPGRTLP